MKKEINNVKNEIMFIDQIIVRLNVYEEVERVNKYIEDGGYFSKNIESYLIHEMKNFANNYDDRNNRVYTITEDVDQYNLREIIGKLILHYAIQKKDALEKLFLLS